MSEYVTVARPYARAAFEFAQEKDLTIPWNEALQFFALVAANSDMQQFLRNPTISADDKMACFSSVVEQSLDEGLSNFLRLLISEHRIAAIGMIAQLFAEYVAELENTITAEITTVFPLDDAAESKLAIVLGKKLDRKVEIVCKVDPQLIGGAMIKADDLVIDGSVRNQLQRLSESMNI